MKIVKKRILALLIFILIFAALYAYACIIFMPKDENDLGGTKYYSYVNFKNEDKNSIDVLVCGNSDIYSGFSPLELYRKTGFTSYVRAAPRESVKNVEMMVRETFKRQTPKLLIIDADCFFEPNTALIGSNLQRIMPALAPINFHIRWKELTLKDFTTLPRSKKSNLKGYILNANCCEYSMPENYMQNTQQKAKKINRTALKDFKKIVKLCNKKNCQLMMVCTPTPYSWSNAKSNAISNLAKKYDIPFIDFNLAQPNFDLDLLKCFNDRGNHLNFYGANYVTDYLAEYLTQNYNLTNHKNEQKFKSWDDLMPYYENLLKENNLL